MFHIPLCFNCISNYTLFNVLFIELLKEEREATQRSPMYSETGRVTHNWEFLKQTEKLRNTVVYVALNGNTIPPQKAVFKESEMEDTNLISKS